MVDPRPLPGASATADTAVPARFEALFAGLTTESGFVRSRTDGRFLWVEPGIERMLGVTAAELGRDPGIWDVRAERIDHDDTTTADGHRVGRLQWRLDDERVLTVEQRSLDADPGTGPVEVSVLRDVTQLAAVQSHLAGEQRRLALVLEGTRLGTWDWDMTSGECTVDDRWAAITGHTVDDLAPATIERWRTLVNPDDLPDLREALQRHVDDDVAYYDVEYRLLHRRGHWVWVHDRAKVVEWSADGQPVRLAGTTEDITRRHRSESAMRKDVLLDPLTRLGNRRLLDARLDELVTAARIEGTGFGVVMVDIDHFKEVNDRLGHLRGDAVLKAVAACLHGAVRPVDTAVRHAGDEFCVLLADADPTAVGLVADRLLEEVRRAGMPADDAGVTVTVSVGAAHSSEVERIDEESVVRLADERLYAAKRSGRDRAETTAPPLGVRPASPGDGPSPPPAATGRRDEPSSSSVG